MKLILTRITEHKSFQDAIGEAKNFVPMPREISKNEDIVKEGKVVEVRNVDLARRTDRIYSVQLVDKLPEPEVEIKEVIKEVPIAVASLDDQELKDLYKEVRDELSKRKQARESDDKSVKVSKARKKRGKK